MPKAKYEEIYNKLKAKIHNGEYIVNQLMPSEHTLINMFDCSRNTVRRAIVKLAEDGYVQSIHGKGVQVIYDINGQSQFSLDSIESLREAAERNKIKLSTKAILFSELTVDQRIAKRTGFEVGTPIYYVQRVRYIDDVPLIIDHNYFRRDVVTGLTKEICEDSIYNYLENDLGINIVTTKRVITVEPITEKDEMYLALDDCNCVACVSNSTYNSDGVMFEFTQSRHSPRHFEFHDVAKRER